MQEREAVDAVLERQLKVEGFFDQKEYHIIVRDRETGKIFKNDKAGNLRNALFCLKGTGIPFSLSSSIIDIEEKMKKEGRWFASWKESGLGTIFYLSGKNAEGGHFFEDILTVAVSSECKEVKIESTIFKFYRKEDRRSVKIVTSQDKKISRSFAGLGNDLAEAAEQALKATHPGYCRKIHRV